MNATGQRKQLRTGRSPVHGMMRACSAIIKRMSIKILLCSAFAVLGAYATINASAQTDLLSTNAKEPGAVVAPSGLVYRSLREGTGAVPLATDRVKVNYRGTFASGEEFDSSYKRNAPLQFSLAGVIPCWTEGVQRMRVGGKAKLTCPAKLAYGDRGVGPIPPNTPLQFEVELLDIASR
jgi:FKBP-type peptidyl-prolyl cis-trans isomerase FkpA